MNVPKHAVLLYSGGLDSTTCLYLLHELGWEVTPLFVDYGQRHMGRERAAALELQPALQAMEIRIPWAANALTGGATLENAGLSPGTTVVPGRNLILLSLANALAEARGCDAVAIGCNRDDAEIYIDCRSGFLSLVGQAIGRKVLAPVVAKTKAEVAVEATRLGVPIERTWSCYGGGPAQCGRCDACVRRANALQETDLHPFRTWLGRNDHAQ